KPTMRTRDSQSPHGDATVTVDRYRSPVATLIHLNGPPGIGKSTIARRYVDEHPGVLNCDIDVLRTSIGGWSTDFLGAGTRIRAAALAMIEAYLATGNDVVRPQMLIDPVELARFEESAASGGVDELHRCHAGLVRLLERRPRAVVIRNTDGAPDDTYERLVASLR